MAEVKWIKLNVGMFDGNSFKKIKKAKIGGESFRDKLTAVWFELMDFAGKCNSGGQLIESPEIPFSNIEDIAIMIDREPDELNLCMQYYINNRMITVIDDVYMLTNWSKYQNEEGLNKIREQTRKRVARHRENQKALACNVTGNVTVTQCNATDIDIEEDTEEDKKKKKRYARPPFVPPTYEEVQAYCESRGNKVDAKQFYDFYDAGKWVDSNGKPVKNWKQKVITWESNRKQKVGANGIAISSGKSDLDGVF